MGRTGVVGLVVAALLTCAACDRGARDNRAGGASPSASASPEAPPPADAAAPASPTPAASSPAPKAAASPKPSPTAAAASPKPPAKTYNMACGTLTVGPGTSGSAPCTVTPAGGFTGKVALGCSAGAGLTCGIAPSEVSVGPDAPATATLTLAVDAAHPGGTSDLTLRADAGSAPRAVTVTVPVPTFSFTCPTGATGGLTQCTLTSVGGFSGTVGITCAGEWACSGPAPSYALKAGATLYPSLAFAGPPYAEPKKVYNFTATAAAGAVTRTATFQMATAS